MTQVSLQIPDRRTKLLRLAMPLALASLSTGMVVCGFLTAAQARPVRVEYQSYPGFGQVTYGSSSYSRSTSYSSPYSSGGFGITVGGYSNTYPSTHYYPGYSPAPVTIVQPGYGQYPVGGSVNRSVLVNPTVINSPIYNSTLINPTIVESDYPRPQFSTPTAGQKTWSRTAIIQLSRPYSRPGTPIYRYPASPYPFQY